MVHIFVQLRIDGKKMHFKTSREAWEWLFKNGFESEGGEWVEGSSGLVCSRDFYLFNDDLGSPSAKLYFVSHIPGHAMREAQLEV